MEIREAHDDLRDEEYPDEGQLISDDDPTLPCPACGGDVHELSDHCPHCGRWLLDTESPSRSKDLLWILSIILAALMSLLYLLWRF